jgi:WD40 repeat protein
MKTFHTFPLPDGVGTITALAFSPAGQHLAGASANGWLLVWNVATGQMVLCRRLAHTPLLSVTWSRNGRCLLLGGANHALIIVQIRDGAIALSQMFAAPVQKVAYARQGRRFLVAAGSTIYVFDGMHRSPMTLAHPSPVIDVAWSPTGGRFAAVCQHEDVFVYNVLRRQTVYTLCEADEPRAVAWNPTGCAVAIGTAQGRIALHHGRTGAQMSISPVSAHPIMSLCWGDPGLFALDEQKMITLWHPFFGNLQGGCDQRDAKKSAALAFSLSAAQIATAMPHGIQVAPVA